jgi:hypothetical protein
MALRRVSLAIVAIIGLIGAAPAQAGSFTATAVGFSFIDATGGSVIAGLTGQDDAAVSVALPFSFSFFGNSFNSVFVSSNGLITFNSANSAFTNQDLNFPLGQPAIAAYWDDLVVAGTANTNVYTLTQGAVGSRQFTIEWAHMSYFDDNLPRTGDFSFEATLFEGSNFIRLNYLNLATGHNGGAQDNAVSATVGVTNGAGDVTQLVFNNGTNAFVGAEKSTLLTPTAAVPEPASLLLIATGLAGLAARRRAR